MTIEHLAQISTLTCLFKSRLDQDDLTCKSCQWWHWINDDNDDTEPGWLAVRVLPTPSCHHCRPGLAVVGVICYQRMLSPSSHQCQFIIAVLIVTSIADITLSHRLILKLAAKVFTWISCQQATALLLTKKIFSEYLKMISQVLCTVAHQWSQLLLKCCRHHPQPPAHPRISRKEIMGLSRQHTAGDQEDVLFFIVLSFTSRWSPRCCLQLPINDFNCCLNEGPIYNLHNDQSESQSHYLVNDHFLGPKYLIVISNV